MSFFHNPDMQILSHAFNFLIQIKFGLAPPEIAKNQPLHSSFLSTAISDFPTKALGGDGLVRRECLIHKEI